MLGSNMHQPGGGRAAALQCHRYCTLVQHPACQRTSNHSHALSGAHTSVTLQSYARCVCTQTAQALRAVAAAEGKEKLEGMLAAAKDVDKDVKFSFRPYDWGVNSK